MAADNSGSAASEVHFTGYDWATQRAWRAPSSAPKQVEYVTIDNLRCEGETVYAKWADGTECVLTALLVKDFMHLKSAQLGTQKNPILAKEKGGRSITLSRLDYGKTYKIYDNGRQICQILTKNFCDTDEDTCDTAVAFRATKFCSELLTDFVNDVFPEDQLKSRKDTRIKVLAQATAKHKHDKEAAAAATAPSAPSASTAAPAEMRKRPAAAMAAAPDAAEVAKKPAAALKRPAAAAAQAEDADDDLEAEDADDDAEGADDDQGEEEEADGDDEDSDSSMMGPSSFDCF